jgi:hypothetical protein
MALKAYASTIWHTLRSKRGEAHTAEQIAFQPRGALTATDMQTAIEQLLSIVNGNTPPGGAPAAYRHIQAIPAAVWTVNHMLGFRPSIQMFDDGGQEIDGAVQHVSNNVLTVSFITTVAGEAYLS